MLLGNIISMLYMLLFPIAFVIPLSKAFGYDGLIWGFFLTPFATVLVYFIVVAIKYGPKKFPLILKDDSKKVYIYDFEVTPEAIVDMTKEAGENLKNCEVDGDTIKRIQLLTEETLMIVYDKNEGKKILGDCTIMIDNDSITVITRDNGKVFDVTNENSDIGSLREYVTARLLAAEQENSYLTTISFNRNCYVWEKVMTIKKA